MVQSGRRREELVWLVYVLVVAVVGSPSYLWVRVRVRVRVRETGNQQAVEAGSHPRGHITSQHERGGISKQLRLVAPREVR
jgi:hypothetical protein